MHASLKQVAREAAIAARSRLTAGERELHSAAIASRLLGLDEVRRARCLALYAAMRTEVDTAPLARAAAAAGKRIAYPRLVAGERALRFACCTVEALVPGALGTREPPPNLPDVLPEDLDAVLVPGLAFDETCARLGRGGGHYDATLARLPAATARIGLAFEIQIVARVPEEAHDVPLDVVVTERRILRRAR